MRFDVGLIGGTGTAELLRVRGAGLVRIPTPFGILRGQEAMIGRRRAVIVSRHGVGHKVPPHAINYRAIASGLAAVGVRACFSTAATGSLRLDWPSGTFVLCKDFVDLTARNLTMFERQVVHTDFSTPFGPKGAAALQRASQEASAALQSGIYVCGNGPRYETPHEIRLYQKLGDVVGMTAATEAILMREASIDYSCLAVVTNAAAGIEGVELSHEEVVAEMRRSGQRAVELLWRAAEVVEL